MRITRTTTTTKTVVAGVLAVFALALSRPALAGAQQPSSEPVPVKTKTPYLPDPVPRRGFNVVLLLGDMQGGDAQENIPVAARKALADMKDFLPYKNYRLLDTQWIIGSNAAAAFTRLRGIDEQEYELELRASPTMMPGTAAPNATNISVRFVLRDAAEASATDSNRTALHPKELEKGDAASLEIGREIFQLERERDSLQSMARNKRKQAQVGVVDPEEAKRMEAEVVVIERRINELKKLAETTTKAGGRPAIDTSFQMTDGETVVVGTSKVKGGGKALIALLTATGDRSKGSTK